MQSYEKLRTPHTIFGSGALAQTGVKLKELGVTKCLIVTTAGMVKRGTVKQLQGYLEEAGITSGVYDRVQPDPPDTNCLEVRQLIRAQGYDGVVGFGGGSAMDVAKVGSLLAGIPDEIEELHDYSREGIMLKETDKRAAVLVTIPTTSGSSAESTMTGVITSTKLHLKYSIGNENTIADLTIIDPQLTLGMPKSLTVQSGLDALTHCMEMALGLGQNDFTNLVMYDCIERIWKWLPAAAEHPDDLEAREQLSWAAHNALCNGGSANGHAVAHAIGAMYHIVHGHACAMTLPVVVRHFSQSPSSAGAIVQIARRIGVPVAEDARANGNAVADAIVGLYKRLGLGTLRQTLQEKGISDSREAFIEKAIPFVIDDFKSKLWDPPIHTGDYRQKVALVLGMIYDEE